MLNMSIISLAYSLILVAVGLLAYFVWGDQQSFTALIPSFAGALFFFLALLSFKSEAFLKHTMHIAAALSLFLFFGSVGGLLKLPTLLTGGEVARPLAVQVQSATAILSFIFVALSVVSFIQIRKLRQKKEANQSNAA